MDDIDDERDTPAARAARLDRIGASVARWVVVLPDADTRLANLRVAIGAGDEAVVRALVAADARDGVEWVITERDGTLRSRLRERWVTPADHDDLIARTRVAAGEVIEQFESGVGDFAGVEPARATPVGRSLVGWVKGKLDDKINQYQRETIAVDVNDVEDRGAGRVGVVGSAGQVGGEQDLGLVELAVDGEVRKAHGLRIIGRCARTMAQGAPELDSPDLAARPVGAASDLARRRARAATAGYLLSLPGHLAGDVDGRHTPAAAVESVKRALRTVLIEAKGGVLDKKERHAIDQVVKRNEHDVLYPVTALLRIALAQATPEERTGRRAAVLGVVADTQDTLLRRTVTPVVVHTSKRITTTAELSPERFDACCGWLDDLARWLQDEVDDPSLREEALQPPLAWLRTAGATPPLERMRREVDAAGPKAAEATRMLGIADVLAAMEVGG